MEVCFLLAEDNANQNLVIVGALTSAITILLREGIPWIWKFREVRVKESEEAIRRRREDEEYRDVREREELSYVDSKREEAFKIVIANLREVNEKLEIERKEEISVLRDEVKQLRINHGDCEKKAEGLKITVAHLQNQLVEIREQNVSLKARIDKSDARRKAFKEAGRDDLASDENGTPT